MVDNGYTRSGVKYYAKIHALDTNGTLLKYYWANTEWPDSGTVTSVDSLEYNVNVATIHNGVPQYIWGRDDDGLRNGGRFVVFADSVPRQVTGLSATMNSGSDSVVLSWGLELDKKDSLETEVQLLIKYSNVGDPDVVLKDYTPAGQFELTQSGTKRSFKFSKVQSEDIRWRVVLRDKRGSETMSEVNSFTIP